MSKRNCDKSNGFIWFIVGGVFALAIAAAVFMKIKMNRKCVEIELDDDDCCCDDESEEEEGCCCCDAKPE